MFFPDELETGAGKGLEAEKAALEKDALLRSAQPADLESTGLELTEKEQEAVAEAGAAPLEETTVENAYITTGCEGCVGNHVGDGVRIKIHNI